MKIRGRTLGALLCSVAILSTAACGSSSEAGGGGEGNYVVGYMTPLSGTEAAPASIMVKAAQLAVEEVNAEGGVLGRTMELNVTDDACDPQTAANAANKLVSQGAGALVAGWCSSAALVAQPIASKASLPLLSLAASPKLVQGGFDNTFLISGTALQQVPSLIFAATDIAKAKNIAVVDDESDYARTLTKAVEEAFPADYAGTLTTMSVADSTKDFGPLIGSLQEKNIDAVIWTGYYVQAATLIKQAAARNFTPQWIVADSDAVQPFIDALGPLAEGILAASPPSAAFYASAEDFDKAFRAKYNEPPTANAIAAYDAIHLLATAIKAANSTDGATVIKELHQVDYTGAMGPFEFTETGDRKNAPFPLVIAENGAWVLSPQQAPALQGLLK